MGRRYNSFLSYGTGTNKQYSIENYELMDLLMKQIASAGDANYANPKTNDFRKNISKRKDVDPNGLFDFAAHGTPYYVNIYVNGKEHKYQDWRVVANIIKHSKDFHGQDIRLLSCHVGVKDDGFAQNLANKLKVNVYASNTFYWSYPDGTHFAADKNSKDNQPNILTRRELIKFSPNNKRRS